jgi:hypothetical protein
MWLRILFAVDLFNFQLKQFCFVARTVLSGDCYMLARPDLCRRCLVTHRCVVVLFFWPFCKNVFPFRYLIRVVECSWDSCSIGSGCAEVIRLVVYARYKFILTFVLLGGRQDLFDFRLPWCWKVITSLHERICFRNIHFVTSCELHEWIWFRNFIFITSCELLSDSYTLVRQYLSVVSYNLVREWFEHFSII